MSGTLAAPRLRPAFTPAQFGDLADVPPELEWLANLTNPKTRRAYKIDVEEFIAFAGLKWGHSGPWPNLLTVQFFQQCLGILQVGGVEAFGEPAIDFG
jgi:hypothetical protein